MMDLVVGSDVGARERIIECSCEPTLTRKLVFGAKRYVPPAIVSDGEPRWIAASTATCRSEALPSTAQQTRQPVTDVLIGEAGLLAMHGEEGSQLIHNSSPRHLTAIGPAFVT